MMNSEQKHTDFSLYTFEEFLQNDFFISFHESSYGRNTEVLG